MEYRGVVPGDAPDPSIESEARIWGLPFPVMKLHPQSAVTRAPIASFAEITGPAGTEELAVTFSYTLWRYPEDRSDPRNEVELDDRTRRAIEDEPAWGRPVWLTQQAQLLRYPMLWEAVQTAWSASGEEAGGVSVPQQLVAHTNHVLRNQFREQLSLPAGPGGSSNWKVTATAVAPSTITVDGGDHPAVHIDTHPFVYSIGYRMNDHVVCTTVLPRNALPYLHLALTTPPKQSATGVPPTDAASTPLAAARRRSLIHSVLQAAIDAADVGHTHPAAGSAASPPPTAARRAPAELGLNPSPAGSARCRDRSEGPGRRFAAPFTGSARDGAPH